MFYPLPPRSLRRRPRRIAREDYFEDRVVSHDHYPGVLARHGHQGAVSPAVEKKISQYILVFPQQPRPGSIGQCVGAADPFDARQLTAIDEYPEVDRQEQELTRDQDAQQSSKQLLSAGDHCLWR